MDTMILNTIILHLVSSRILAILLANLLAAGAFETHCSIFILETYEHVISNGDFFVEACFFVLYEN